MQSMKEFFGKEVATLLTPTTVTLVTARDTQGDCIATCAWANPLSHEPSLIGVCLRPDGRTARAIEQGGCFVVNVLGADAASRDCAIKCGKKGPDQPERFEAAQIKKEPAAAVEAVRVKQAIAWIECELVETRSFGDHMLYVGRTLKAVFAGGTQLLMQGRGSFGSFTELDE